MSRSPDGPRRETHVLLVSDDKRFIKNPDANVVMTQLKTLVGKGLFTSTVDAPEWGVARMSFPRSQDTIN